MFVIISVMYVILEFLLHYRVSRVTNNMKTLRIPYILNYTISTAYDFSSVDMFSVS